MCRVLDVLVDQELGAAVDVGVRGNGSKLKIEVLALILVLPRERTRRQIPFVPTR